MKHKKIEFSQVTTRGGDTGQSSLMGGERAYKDDLVFEVLGNLDGLNTFIAFLRQYSLPSEVQAFLQHVQEKLWTGMSSVATHKKEESIPCLTEEDVERIEREQKTLLDKTPITKEFTTPGSKGGFRAAYCHITRTKVRDCERIIVRYIRSGAPRIEYGCLYELQRYLNRLSDYFFVLSRFIEST